MRLKDAVTKCLNRAGKPLNAPELREELLNGGYQTKSKDFRAQIYNVLTQDPKFANEGGKWSLAAWTD